MKKLDLSKVKDWLSITGIRITNFIKEHKYVSLVIGLFLVSAVIAMIVKAEDDTLTKVDDFEVTNFSYSTNKRDNTASNFSTIQYKLDYILGKNQANAVTCEAGQDILDKVIITATLSDDSTSEVQWNKSGEISEADDSDSKKTITMVQENVRVCKETSITFYLKVNNASANSKIQVQDVQITPGSQAEDKKASIRDKSSSTAELAGLDQITSTYSKEISELEAIPVSGVGEKTSDSKRNIKYGIMLGFFDENGNSINNLEDYHIKDSADVYMYAKENNSNLINILTTSDLAGVYNNDVYNRHYFNSLPLLTTSGKAEFSSNVVLPTTDEVTNISAPSIKVTPKIESLSYDQGANILTLINSLNKIEVNGEEKTCVLSSSSLNTCVVDPSNIDLTKEGEYTVSYSVKTTTGQTTLNQKINVVKETLEDQTDSYSLTSAETQSDSAVVTSKSVTTVDANANFEETTLLINNENKTPSSIDNASRASIGDKTITVKYSNEKNSFELYKTLSVTMGYYLMNVKNISIPNELTKVNIDNRPFTVIGTYYVTVESTSLASKTNLYVFTKTDKSNERTDSLTTASVSTGNNSVSNNLYVTENYNFEKVTSDDKTNDEYFTAAVGETVQSSTVINYGIDADNSMKNVEILLDVDNNYINPIAYSTEAEDMSYYKIDYDLFGNSISGPTETIEYCTSNSCADPATYDNFNDITSIKVKITSNGDELKPGIKITLKSKYIVKNFPTDDFANAKFNSTATVKFNSGTTPVSMTPSASKFVYLTPYKYRSELFLGKGDNLNSSEITLDASNSSVYTALASPSVISPIMERQTDIFGYDKIDPVTITFTLPKGVNYVKNAEYEMQPISNNGVVINSDGTTTITYMYPSQEPNTAVTPIYFDFTIDVAIAQSELSIKMVIGDNNFINVVNLKNDLSSYKFYKEKTAKITVFNSEDLAYGQYTYNENRTNMVSSVNKDTNFVFETKLFNNLDRQITSADVYTILPYNDAGNSNFSGTYTVKLPEVTGAEKLYCTTAKQSEILSSPTSVTWTDDCSSYKKGDVYSGITGYRITYSNINSKTSAIKDAIIYPVGNASDDYYMFDSVLTYNNDGRTITKNFKSITVKVASKKISGIVWEDFDEDGLIDEDEKKIDNVTLKLHLASSGEVLQTTMPNSKGKYEFSGLEDNTYYVSAEYNTDKYGVTTTSPIDLSDLKIISVFTIPESLVVPEDSQEDDINELSNVLVRTNDLVISSTSISVENINLGLTLKHKFQAKVSKYITSAEITNPLGVVTRKEYGNAKLAKLDVKNMNNSKIKVTYTIEIQNVKYYPGYVTLITDIVPDGMSFNPNYEENKTWELTENGILRNESLAGEVIGENEKKYLTVSFDITRKEAGTFINTVSVDETQIFGGVSDEN